MKNRHYTVQLVGNTDSIKRMVASLYLVNSKKQKQILKVCICDDLPHVINEVENTQRTSFAHELLQSGIILQVNYGRSLRIKLDVNEPEVCAVTPLEEISIPPEIIWESNAALATDFQLHLTLPVKVASLQVSISSLDNMLNEVPLAIPHRIQASWLPGSNISGVQRIRDAMEANAVTQKKERIFQKLNFEMATQKQGYKFQRDNLIRSNLTKDRITTPTSEFRSASPLPVYVGTPVGAQDKTWNIVTTPTRSEPERKLTDEIPHWASVNSDYGEVIVV